jgi:D-xylose transport system permease protein
MTSGQGTAAPPAGRRIPLPRPPADFGRRFLQGDLASLRVIIAIALIWAIFQIEQSRFLSAANLTNLALQITATGLISVGVVLVLLIGEIDLSVGSVSGLTSAIVAVLSVQHGWNAYLAIAAGIAAGAGIGLFQGFVFDFFGIPSFVVTLAGLLAWEGFQLRVLGGTGTVNLTDPKITGLTGTFYGHTAGWGIAVVGIAAYAATALSRWRMRIRAGISAPPLTALALRIGVVAAVVIAVVAELNSDRGVPLAVLILVGFVLLFQYVTTRTRFGRHIFAIGGNAEAARRAGISTRKVRVMVFMLASSMAAVGGIMAASRLFAVNQSSGGSDLLLLSIAGPVVAGTSLFGGRGGVWTALLGAIVIGSISNGMDLLALDSSIKFIVTGAVLLAAVVFDALARNRRTASGRV